MYVCLLGIRLLDNVIKNVKELTMGKNLLEGSAVASDSLPDNFRDKIPSQMTKESIQL